MKKLLKKNLKIVARKTRKAKRVVLIMSRRAVKKSKRLIRDVERARQFMAERAEELIQVQYLQSLCSEMVVAPCGNTSFPIRSGLRGTFITKTKKAKLNSLRFNLSKAGALLMVFALILQLAGTIPFTTLAYLVDEENSSGNAITAASLDYILEDGAWSDYTHLGGLLPGDSIERPVTVRKLNGLDFEYNIEAKKIAGSLAYCNALEIKALRENVEMYSGSLLGLNIDPLSVIAGDGTDEWKFILSLPAGAEEFASLSCEFNLEFTGRQRNLLSGGFEDIEILGNVAEGISNFSETQALDDFVLGISPIGDAYVDQHSPNNEYGNQTNLFVRSKQTNANGQENRRLFVQFNVPLPPIASVTSASLKLRLTNAPGEDRILEASRALSTWTEDGINWGNQPSVSAAVSGPVNTGVLNDVWKSWDVTSDMQSFASGTETNFGWRIRDASEGSNNSQESSFASRENSTEIYGPILEISLKALAATTTHLVINEVYYNVGSAGVGNNSHNEWVEIYNPTNSPVDISGWKICDNSAACDVIPTTTPILAKGFAVITNKASTWDYWPNIPSGAVKIELDSEIGGGLANTGDRVILKNSSDAVIDQLSYGDDATIFNPAVSHSGNGRSVARIIKGYDTDSANDWIINATPNPGTNPSVNGEEVMRFTFEGMEIAQSINELPILVDNPSPQLVTVTSKNFEPECACSEAGHIIEATPEPKILSDGDSTENIVQVPVEEAITKDLESIVPEISKPPEVENDLSEEKAVTPALAPETAPVPETPEAVVGAEPNSIIEETPVSVSEPVQQQAPPEIIPVAVATEVEVILAAPEQPETGGSNE